MTKSRINVAALTNKQLVRDLRALFSELQRRMVTGSIGPIVMAKKRPVTPRKRRPR